MRLPLKGLYLATAVILLGCVSGPASAHVLKTDGTIGAVMHVSPDDNPRTGGPTPIIFFFDDSTGRFSLSKCICTLTIQRNGVTISARPLAITAAQISDDSYTFPEPGRYNVQVSGQPKTAAAFEPFVLDYGLQVAAGNGGVRRESFPVLVWAGLGLMMGLIVLAGYRSQRSS